MSFREFLQSSLIVAAALCVALLATWLAIKSQRTDSSTDQWWLRTAASQSQPAGK